MNRIEEALQKLFNDHRIIFWYDEKTDLFGQYDEVELPGIEKIHVQNNSFYIKHLVTSQKPGHKFLLYFTEKRPENAENWLLDLELANYLFHTDQEALFLQELELDYQFKELVTTHLEFFKNKERRAALKELLGKGDEHLAIRYKMLAVLFNTEN
ncbi:MAG: BREX-1 system phosphatase PglZ type A, partial [Bacteroidetes bacterium]|nr:BREX-1 system phosphatase PglZ type A [Bacteroidota bacterium]